MKVKKRQYRSKRGRPLKSSKLKSKAKKGSKRRVKKMRGGEYEYNYKHIDFYWRSDEDVYIATFYGDISNNIGVIVIPERKYIFNEKGISQIKNTDREIYDEMSNEVLFNNISAKKKSVLIEYNNRLNNKTRRSDPEVHEDLENFAQNNFPEKHVKFDPSSPYISELISNFQAKESDQNNSQKTNLMNAKNREFIWDED